MSTVNNDIDAGLESAVQAAQLVAGVAAPTYLDDLLASGLLISTGVDGLYGRSQLFEEIVERLNDRITELGADQQPEVLRFPPAMNRTDFEHSDYLKSFPQLAGTVHSFCGNEREHQRLLRCLDQQEDWTEQQQPTRIVLTPAACYPIYPVMAQRGPLPENGRTVDVLSYCFRHEPSLDPGRMQMFRQREYVRLGSPEQIVATRGMWMERGSRLVEALQLPFTVEVANDAFFGRGGKIVADSQRAQELKFELLIPGINPEKPTACLSFNYHMDHFGGIWNIRTASGGVAHTGCIGFGMERITLSLFRHHGFDVEKWPQAVRDFLWSTR